MTAREKASVVHVENAILGTRRVPAAGVAPATIAAGSGGDVASSALGVITFGIGRFAQQAIKLSVAAARGGRAEERGPMSRDETSRPPLAHVRYLLPDVGWSGWNPGSHISGVAGEIASRLADAGDAQATARHSVELINADSLRKGGIVVQNAIWVPERVSGEVAGILDVTVISAPGGDAAPERHLARNLRKDFGWLTRIVDYAASTAQVPAGRMTIEQVLLRRFGERQVQAYLFLNVFPPGACEAASLVFNTVHLDLVTELARQARMIAETLELTLGDIPGGRRKL